MKNITAIMLSLIIFISPLINGCSKGEKKGGDKKTIKFYTMYSMNEQGKIYEDMIKKYEKNNPEVKIEMQEIINDEEKIKSMTSNGDIDLIGIKRNQVIEYAKSGYLTDLTDFISTNELEEKLYKISTAYGKYNGKIYGIADSPITMEIYYNKDVFNKYDIKEPTNLREFTDTCNKLKGNRVIPFEIGALDTWTLSLFLGTITSQTTGARGLTERYDTDIKSMSNINGIDNAFAIYNNICSKFISKECLDINYKQCVTDFINGKTAMIPGGSFTAKLIDEIKHSNFHYGILNEPVEYVQKPVSLVSASGGEVFSVPTNSKNVEEAKKFLKYIFTEEAQNMYVSKGYTSSLKSVNKGKNEIEKVVLEHIERADENSIIFMDNIDPKISENTGRTLQEIVEGNVRPSDAWKRILKQSYKK